MRTLIQSSALFLAQGVKPRLFVRTTDTDGTVLAQGTKAVGEYEDRVYETSEINQSIRHDGGMAEVSGADVSRVILDERLTLCSEASLVPYATGTINGAGRLLKQGTPTQPYSNVRNSTDATDYQTPAIVVGRNYSSGSLIYSVYRGPLEFYIPASLETCEDAYIELTGMSLNTPPAFSVYAVAGTWTSPITTAAHNDFTGWAASGAYSVANLIESWTTAEYGTTVYLRLNTSGKTAIETAAAGTGYLKLMLLSSKDADNAAAPSGAEYVQFEASTARLKLRYNSKTLDNQDTEILLGLEPLPATISNATIDAVWKGVVDEYSIGDRALDLRLRQNDLKKNSSLPRAVISKTAWPDCPEENIGKGHPIVYGEFFNALYGDNRDGIGRDDPPVPGPNQALGLRGYVPGIVVKNYGGSYSEPGKIVFSGGAILNPYFSVPALWNSTRKTFERYWIDFVDPNLQTASDGSRYLEFHTAIRSVHSGDGDPISNEEYIGRAFSVIPSRVTRYDATNPEHAYSGVVGEYALLDGANAYFEMGFEQQGAFSERERVEAVFNLTQTGAGTVSLSIRETDSELNGATGSDGESLALPPTIPTVRLFNSATANFLSAGISTDDILVILSGVNAGEWPIDSVYDNTNLLLKWEMTAETGQSYKVISRGAELENTGGVITTTGQKCVPITTFTEEPTKYIVRFDQTTGAGTFEISNFQIRMFMPENEKPNIVYFDKSGKAYGSWITGRGETAGNLIENPAHIIESIARDEMELLTAEIDTAAFDSAATARSGDKFAFQLIERKHARDILNDLAFQGRMFVWWDEQDRLTVKAFNAAAYFPNSGTDIPGALDIFTITGTPVSGAFTNHPIIKTGDDFITRMQMDDCKNDFVIKYRQNYATNDYAEVLTCNTDDNNLTDGYLSTYTAAQLQALCTASEAAILTRNTLTVEAWAIRDESTANKLAEHLIERLTKRRYIIRFVAGISALCFEPGDFINVRDDRIYDLFGTAVTERKKWMVIKHNPSLSDTTIEIEAIEV